MVTIRRSKESPRCGAGDDLAALLGDAVERAGGLQEGDVLVVAQKIVSKAEGRIERDPGGVGWCSREAAAVRRQRGDLVIAETEHGFVCASAGVDRSNAPDDGLGRAASTGSRRLGARAARRARGDGSASRRR